MSRFSRQLLNSALAVAMLSAGFAASMHNHRTAGPNGIGQEKAAGCSCHLHPQANQQPGQPAREDQQSDQCLLCRLVAEFHAEVPLTIETEFDSMISCLVAVETAAISHQTIRPFQGRAPPVV